MNDQIVWQTDVLPPSLCELLLSEQVHGDWGSGLIGAGSGSTVEDKSVRDATIHWLASEHWLSVLMAAAVCAINDRFFYVEITDQEAVQLTKYQVGGHYSWHYDQLDCPYEGDNHPEWSGKIRKLSAILQLSDPTQYKGGDVLAQEAYGRILNGYERGEDWKRQGSLLVFPSTLQHCVAPVRAGVRVSAVLWTLGPPWR